MHKVALATIFLFTVTLTASASKLQGRSVLKDLQPTGATNKEHKHQAFDLTFNATGKNYTCRTDPHHSMNAVDFVVGHAMSYEIDGKKVKIKTDENKKVDCKIVRVEDAGTL